MNKIALTLIGVLIAGLVSSANATRIYPSKPSGTITLKDDIKYSSVHIGDINNDGAKDILVCMHGDKDKSGSVAAFYQKKGKFSSKPDLEIPIKDPKGAVIKDIDGDGKNDIAVNETLRYLYLCYAKKNFKPKKYFDVNMTSNDLLDVNLNKSTKLGASLLGLSVWWRVDKHGKVRETYIDREPDNLSGFPAAGDLNNDGEMDLVFPRDYNLILYYGPFPPAEEVNAEMLSKNSVINAEEGDINSVCIGDYNGDSRQDIATQTEQGIFFYNQNAPVDFSEKASAKIAGKFSEIKSADVNNDKLDDIIAISGDLKCIYIFLQKKNGKFAKSTEKADQIISGDRYYDLTIDDINGDGKKDLCVSGCGNFVNIFYAR